jgi:hypothetical protein
MKPRILVVFGLSVAVLAGACASPVTPLPPTTAPTAATTTSSLPPVATTLEPASSDVILLPKPVTTGNSVEICLNSRYSEHSLTGTAGLQQMANILWAAGRVPVAGSVRYILVTTPGGEFIYSPANSTLSRRSSKTVSGGAFVIDCQSELPFDTGVAYMTAITASVSSWKSAMPAVANCPKMTSMYFGVQQVGGLTTKLAAHCSLPKGDPGWLPDPATDGTDKVEVVLADLKYINKFSSENLTLAQVSQLLWAGYGCTPHVADVAGRQGITVPSAMAEYYLTGTIYLVNEKGIYRYQNRNPAADLSTADHRLEALRQTDARKALQSAVGGLPQAPAYLVVALGGKAVAGAQATTWALMEVGFLASNVLLQASALGLGCDFDVNFTTAEQAAVQQTTGIPANQTPRLIISLGNPAP